MRNRILKSRVMQALLRRAVMLLVLVGFGRQEELLAQPPGLRPTLPGGGGITGDTRSFVPITTGGRQLVVDDHEVERGTEFPAELTEDAARNWAWSHLRNGTQWAAFSKAVQETRRGDANLQRQDRQFLEIAALMQGMPESFQKLLRAEKAAGNEGVTLQALMTVTDDLVKVGLYHPCAVGYLWHAANERITVEEAQNLAKFYARLEELLRADNALRLAEAATSPIVFTGWMSKAGASVQRSVVPAGFVEAAKKAYGTANAGLWETEGVLSFRMGTKGGACTLWRRGKQVALKPGTWVHLRRLDVLVVGNDDPQGVTLEHRMLGEVKVPPGTVLTVQGVAGRLGEEARKKIDEWVKDALGGDLDAVHLLEMVLPAAEPTIRAALKEHPKDRGAPGLRMLLESTE